LHTSFENLNFQIVNIYIKMHYLCPETSIYVPITHVIFHHTIIDQVQIQHCSKALEIISLHDVMDVLGLDYLSKY